MRQICGLAVVTDKYSVHRFGAVMEEFEVRDALEATFSTKPEQPHGGYSL